MGIPKHPFGWRGRIGLISPTVIEMISYDFYRVAPAGVDLCAISSNIDFWDKSNFKQALDAVLESCAYLESRQVDCIVHCGMPLVTTRGKGFEEELVKSIRDKTGIVATTSIRSAVLALKHLAASKVALVSPYPQELHQSAAKFLTDSGLEVTDNATMDVPFKKLQDVSPEQIAATARRVYRAGGERADAIYIPCNQWAAADAVSLIEGELGVPVVSGAHADFWEAFRMIGIHDHIEGNGALLGSLANAPR